MKAKQFKKVQAILCKSCGEYVPIKDLKASSNYRATCKLGHNIAVISYYKAK